MKCSIKYRPIVDQTPRSVREAMINSLFGGPGICPACEQEGLAARLEERHGQTV